MPVIVKLVGFKVEDKRLRRLTGQMHARAMRICEKYAKEAEGQAKALMDEPKHGRVYGKHIASAPGEAPAVDTGNLKNSIGTKGVSHGWAVTVKADYGVYLEFGTVRIAPRPFLKPVVEDLAGPFLKELEERVFKA